MNNELSNKLVEILNQLQSSAPKATQLAIQVIWYDCVGNIIIGIICILPAILCAIYFIKLLKLFTDKNNYYTTDKYSFGMIGCGAAFTILSVCILINFLDIWNWVGIFHPDLTLAHNLLGKINQ